MVKIVNIEEENFNIFWTTWRILTFRKAVTYDNIKSHTKSMLHPLSKNTFLKNPQGGASNWTPIFFSVNYI